MDTPAEDLPALLRRIRACRLCEAELPHLGLILRVGQYAQRYYLGARAKTNLTETVLAWREAALTLYDR